MTMGEEEENNNSMMMSRTQSSLELLCNTAAWKNAVEKTWTSTTTSPATTINSTASNKHPTEVHIQNQPVGSSSLSNNYAFARSTSTLSLAPNGGNDAASVNHVTTASSVSSFDDYSTSPLSTSSVIVQQQQQLANADNAAAAYRTAMTGLPLRLLGMPNMMNLGGGGHATAAAAASSTPHLHPMMMMPGAASSGAPFSSATSHFPSFEHGRAATMVPALSLPTLSSHKGNNNKKGDAAAVVPPLFHLEKTRPPHQGSSSAAALLAEANLIHLAAKNSGYRTPSPPQDMVMTEVQQPLEEQVVADPVPAPNVVGPKNKKKLVAIMTQENKALKQQVTLKDKEIMKLRKEMADLKNQIQELRQLPTGKISQIPVEDMIEMMQLYGSEVSDSVMPIRKNQNIQKASVVRQFRRWNPNFLEHFHHVHGKWTPKLGRDGELQRRQEARVEARRKSSSGVGGDGCSSVAGSVGSASLTTTKINKFNINNTMGLTNTTTTKVSRKKMKKSSP